MDQNVFVSLYLDTRRAKANGKFPVKIRVFTSLPRIQKLYPTKFEFTERDFQSIWGTLKPRIEHKSIRASLQAVETKAVEVADGLSPFTFKQFEKRLFRSAGDGANVFYRYEQVINTLKENNQLGTASSYECSLRSIKKFIKETSGKGREPEKLFFYDITKDWLTRYERYMIRIHCRSHATVGIYLRPLRALFRSAIKNKEIHEEIYPFGKEDYKIPASQKVKKALAKEQLKSLFFASPDSPDQQKARDFWFFSYSCNGMNIKDIALLKWKDINGDTLTFYRAKTINTSRGNLTPIHVSLTEFSQNFIQKYSHGNKEESQYVFDIVNMTDSELLKRSKIQNFTRYINQHIKKLAKSLELTEDISTYYARHSFATGAIRSGASMEFVSEALGHSNLKTTQGYFAGFEESDKREMAEVLMNFD